MKTKRIAILAALAITGITTLHAEESKPAAKPAAATKPAAAATKPAAASTPAAGDLKSEDDKTFYALGLAVARNLGMFELTSAELTVVQQGIRDGVLKNTPKVDLQTYGPKLQPLAQARAAAAATREKAKGKEYLDKAAKEPGMKKTASGLLYKETLAGTGASPKATDTVKVNYTGTLISGEVFDSSVQKGQPIEFPLTGVVPCWSEGLQLMKKGGKAHLVCPSELGWGDQGSPPAIKPGAVVIFDVELLDILPPPPPAAEAPKDDKKSP